MLLNTEADVVNLESEQINLFNKESLRAIEANKFNPSQFMQKYRDSVGRKVLGIDMGGGKAVASVFRADPQGLVTIQEDSIESRDGEGYWEFLEKVSMQFDRNSDLVGLSMAGPVRENKIIGGPNLPIFIENLESKGSGNLDILFGENLVIVNDAIAGLIASWDELNRQNKQPEDIIFFINGGGIGGAVLSNNQMWATEPGHIRAVEKFTIYKALSSCPVPGNDYVCVENIAASGAGIESRWKNMTGNSLTGKEIARLYEDGNDTAYTIYKESALISAHVVAGLMQAFGFSQSNRNFHFVLHGGIFNVDGYGDYLVRILKENYRKKIEYIMTPEMGVNMSLRGAALSTFIRN